MPFAELPPAERAEILAELRRLMQSINQIVAHQWALLAANAQPPAEATEREP